MKAKVICVLFLIVTLTLVFSGCEYYDDELISVVYDAPNEDGIISYEAGISVKQNAARLNKLEYQIEKAENNQITIKFPETVKNDSGTEYKIQEFGGSTGTNAPLEHFLLIININEDLIENKPVSLTIDVGTLPLDVTHWMDIEIHCKGSVLTIQVQDVKFISNQPLIYSLLAEEIDENDEKSYVMSSEKWYQIPNKNYQGGETVIIKLKHPKNGISRSLRLNNRELHPTATYDDYIEYEFVMPYHDSTLSLVDVK